MDYKDKYIKYKKKYYDRKQRGGGNCEELIRNLYDIIFDGTIECIAKLEKITVLLEDTNTNESKGEKKSEFISTKFNQKIFWGIYK